VSLTKYAKKRDFTRTPEPTPREARSRSGMSFVVQKHDASRLHYDLRLELDGVLKSWAVPKGPSLDPADKRLAVEVEDHPLGYGGFEGTIPKGEYGGGTVMLWDRGEWTSLDKDPAAALRKGRMSFTLNGEKLHGGWTLTRIKGKEGDSRDNWLLIKRRDETAREGGAPIVDTEGKSVLSERSLEEIAAADDTVTPSAKRKPKRADSAPKKVTRRTTRAGSRASSVIDPSGIEHARKAAMPRTMTPQLCTVASRAPTGKDWIHEIKYDGYRFLVWRDGAKVRLINRSGLDWTARFKPITEAVERLGLESAILDGEAVVLDGEGRSSFQGLQQAIKSKKFSRLRLALFDMPYCNGFDLTQATLRDRKALLNRVVALSGSDVLIYSDHIDGSGEAVEMQACKLGLEGIVSKDALSVYTPRRSRSWLKIKCSHRQEFVVVGYTPPAGGRKHFGALLLGAHDEKGRLVYTGRVGTGFSSALLKDIGTQLDKLATKESALDVGPTREEQLGVRWVKPRLVGEVEFKEWTEDGRLRQPSFQGLREDKKAAMVKIERVGVKIEATSEADAGDGDVARGKDLRAGVKKKGRDRGATVSRAAKATARGGAAGTRSASFPTKRMAGPAKGGDGSVAGVRISSPDRVVFADQNITKLELAEYYDWVAAVMLPYLLQRPLSVVRCPSGQGKACFFQKHLGDTFTAPIVPLRVKEKNASEDYLSIDAREGLLTLVQFGVIEIHPWGSRGDRLEQPDMLTFDLDPDASVPFDSVKEAAVRVREVLKDVGLESFLKTSGGKGLHVVVPLTRHAEWDEAKEFAGNVSRMMERAEPTRYIASMSKHKRRGKIFIDYLRNGRGATSVAPYSVRARTGAPVSMPIAWKDLDTLESAAEFTVREPGRSFTDKRADPWRGFFGIRQRLTSAMRKSVV